MTWGHEPRKIGIPLDFRAPFHAFTPFFCGYTQFFGVMISQSPQDCNVPKPGSHSTGSPSRAKCAEHSISNRPKEADGRNNFGHWEVDTVKGGKDKPARCRMRRGQRVHGYILDGEKTPWHLLLVAFPDTKLGNYSLQVAYLVHDPLQQVGEDEAPVLLIENLVTQPLVKLSVNLSVAHLAHEVLGLLPAPLPTPTHWGSFD